MSTNPLAQSLPSAPNRQSPFAALVGNAKSGTAPKSTNPLAAGLANPEPEVEETQDAGVDETTTEDTDVAEQTPDQVPAEVEDNAADKAEDAEKEDEPEPASEPVKAAPKKATKAPSKTPSKTASKSTTSRTSKATKSTAKSKASAADTSLDDALTEISDAAQKVLRPLLRSRLATSGPVDGIREAEAFEKEITETLAAVVAEVTEPTVSAYKDLLLALAGGEDGEYDGYTIADGKVETT